MAEAGLLVKQDAELRANLDALRAFAKRKSRPGTVVINPPLSNDHNHQGGRIGANWAALSPLARVIGLLCVPAVAAPCEWIDRKCPGMSLRHDGMVLQRMSIRYKRQQKNLPQRRTVPATLLIRGV